jgi:hypothetical protein
MTIETAIIICIAAAFACYLVYRWQLAAVPPYQEPVKYEQDDGALTSDQLEQIKDTLEPTPLNPKAAWPFPIGSKP